MVPMKIPSIGQTRRLLAKRAISAQEVLQDHVKRVHALNPALNALPTLCLDRAVAEAKAALERTLAASDELTVYRESIQKAREVKQPPFPPPPIVKATNSGAIA